MKITAKRAGLSLVAVASIVGIGLVAAPASADRKLRCNFSGTWIEQNDNFGFAADYWEKNGPDTFSGVYVNSSAGAQANVTGAASNGTWVIKLTYTDAGHRGQERRLSGQGKMAGGMLTVSGPYSYWQGANQIGKGNFKLVGQCK